MFILSDVIASFLALLGGEKACISLLLLLALSPAEVTDRLRQC